MLYLLWRPVLVVLFFIGRLLFFLFVKVGFGNCPGVSSSGNQFGKKGFIIGWLLFLNKLFVSAACWADD